MDIINKIKHDKLGNIFCIADESGNPWQWVKDENVKIFSSEVKKIRIKFNFYCYNKFFKYAEYLKDSAKKIDKGITQSYREFLKDIKNIENEFYETFKIGELEEVLDINIDSKDITKIEDLYKYIEVKEIRIYDGGYSVIMSTKWIKEDIGIERWNIFDEESWYNINLECEIQPVEMNYRS